MKYKLANDDGTTMIFGATEKISALDAVWLEVSQGYILYIYMYIMPNTMELRGMKNGGKEKNIKRKQKGEYYIMKCV